VSAISPTEGPEGGKTKVKITGTNLAKASAAEFGASAGTILKSSATEVEVESPAHAAGAVEVTVTTAGGKSATNPSKDQFTYVAPPAVSSISPTEGPEGGKTKVKITGTNLAKATTVDFGASAGTILKSSATEVEAESPAHAAGAVEVTVTTAGGKSAANPSKDQFTY